MVYVKVAVIAVDVVYDAMRIAIDALPRKAALKIPAIGRRISKLGA